MELHIKDYLTSEKNASPAFAKAIADMKEGDVLLLDGGIYHCYPEGAFRKEYYISNNDGGDKPIALPLLNKKDITVDGGGGELIFHGGILPIVVDRCQNVTLKNFAIDYEGPFYAQSRIAEVTEQGILLQFDGKEFHARVEEGRICFFNEKENWSFRPERALSLEFDENGHPSSHSGPYFAYMGEPKDHGFLSFLFQDVRPEQRGENRIFLYGEIAKRHTAGNHLVMTYAGRRFPGCLINEAKGVTLEDVRLYYTASMGVLAQLSEDLTLNRVVAQPREHSGRLLSTNADATHFVNCRGKITLRDCKFVQMMDDASNVHGIYNLYRERPSERCIRLGYGHGQQIGINLYRPGDQIALIECETNETRAVATVQKSTLLSERELELILDREVPAPEGRWVTENLSTAPEVHYVGCETGHNRPRGFLISTRGRTLVENCVFYNMNQGIQLSGEMKDWFESGPVTDVCIRNCRFSNSAYAGGVAIRCKPVLYCTEPVFNKKITIEDNVFTQASRRICSIESCEEVIFRNNRFCEDPTLPYHRPHGEDGTSFKNCRKLIKEEAK